MSNLSDIERILTEAAETGDIDQAISSCGIDIDDEDKEILRSLTLPEIQSINSAKLKLAPIVEAAAPVNGGIF